MQVHYCCASYGHYKDCNLNFARETGFLTKNLFEFFLLETLILPQSCLNVYNFTTHCYINENVYNHSSVANGLQNGLKDVKKQLNKDDNIHKSEAQKR